MTSRITQLAERSHPVFPGLWVARVRVPEESLAGKSKGVWERSVTNGDVGSGVKLWRNDQRSLNLPADDDSDVL